MDCQTARKWTSPYLDSELETAKTFEISEHLRACEACRRRFNAERQVDDMIRDRLAREAMPPEAWSRIRREVNRSSFLRRVRGPAIVAAAACLMLSATMYFSPGLTGNSNQEVFSGQWAQYLKESPALDHNLSDAEIEAALTKEYGLTFSTSRKDTDGHPVQVVGARHVRFGDQPAFELRLKCCGRDAVITAVHRSDVAKLPIELRELADEAAGKSIQRAGIYLQVDTIGDTEFFIASEHHLDGLVGVMKDASV
ncbi:MAG: zf-HC2 domain-containing protein [Phycisphaerales bacterium]|nr:zf-HC2 domain-containing protein [Phycisphaerales bacterium]